MHTLRRLLSTAALCVGAAFTSLAAHGAVVYSNLGPGDSFDNGTGWSLSNSLPQDAAMSFVAGADFSFTSVELALTNVSASALSITLRSDAGGLPGGLLETILVAVPGGPSLVTAMSALNPLLDLGATYWITAEAPAGFEGSWQWADPSDVGATAFSFDQAVSWSAFTLDRGAFRVNGDLVAQVPAPSTLALVALALLAAGAVQRRRR